MASKRAWAEGKCNQYARAGFACISLETVEMTGRTEGSDFNFAVPEPEGEGIAGQVPVAHKWQTAGDGRHSPVCRPRAEELG